MQADATGCWLRCRLFSAFFLEKNLGIRLVSWLYIVLSSQSWETPAYYGEPECFCIVNRLDFLSNTVLLVLHTVWSLDHVFIGILDAVPYFSAKFF